MTHDKMLGRTALQELDLLVKQLHVVKIGTVMIYRRVRGISQESGFPNGEHQGALGMATGDRLNANSQAIFKQQGRFYNLSAAADTNVLVAMTICFATYIEVIKLNPRQVEEVVPMEMGNDDIFLERSGTRHNATARQIVDEIYRLVAGAHVKNPPGGLATDGVYIGTQRACFAGHRRRQMKDS